MSVISYHNGDFSVRAHPTFPNLYGDGDFTVAGTAAIAGAATVGGALTVTGALVSAGTSSTGADRVAFSAITTSTTLAAATHSNVSASTSGGAVVLTLPASVTGNVGTIFVIEKGDTSANLLTITPNGTDTIDGVNASIVVMGMGSSVTLVASGTGAWVIISRTVRPFVATVTTTSTLAGYHDIVLVNAAGATTTTLLSTAETGKIYRIKNIGAGAATISAGAGTIDGAGTYSLAVQYDAATFVHNGSNVWYALAIGP